MNVQYKVEKLVALATVRLNQQNADVLDHVKNNTTKI